MLALDLVRVQYSPRKGVDFVDLPDCIAVEWIPNRSIKRAADLSRPLPGELTFRGTVYTHDPETVETLIDLTPFGDVDAFVRLRFDYRTGDGTIRRKTLGPVIFGTAGGYFATIVDQPPASIPRVQRISFVLSVPENGTLAAFITNETLP